MTTIVKITVKDIVTIPYLENEQRIFKSSTEIDLKRLSKMSSHDVWRVIGGAVEDLLDENYEQIKENEVVYDCVTVEDLQDRNISCYI